MSTCFSTLLLHLPQGHPVQSPLRGQFGRPYIPSTRYSRFVSLSYSSTFPLLSPRIWLLKDGPAAAALGDPLDILLIHRCREAGGWINLPLGRLEVVVECHTIVEHKAVAFPEAGLFGHQFHIAQNAAFQMIHMLESFLL